MCNETGIGTCVYDKLRLVRLHINHFGKWKMCVLRITQHELTGFTCLDAGTDKLYIDNKYPDFLTIFLDIRKCWMNVPLTPIISCRSAHANQKVDIGSLFRKKKLVLARKCLPVLEHVLYMMMSPTEWILWLYEASSVFTYTNARVLNVFNNTRNKNYASARHLFWTT